MNRLLLLAVALTWLFAGACGRAVHNGGADPGGVTREVRQDARDGRVLSIDFSER